MFGFFFPSKIIASSPQVLTKMFHDRKVTTPQVTRWKGATFTQTQWVQGVLTMLPLVGVLVRRCHGRLGALV